MNDDIEQIAPTPWVKDDKFPGIVLDARGSFVCAGNNSVRAQIDLRRDHIIRCVNGCEKMNPEAVPELLAVCGELDNYFGKSWDHDSFRLAFAKATLVVAARVRAVLARAKVPDA
jgi:hypothetical protein